MGLLTDLLGDGNATSDVEAYANVAALPVASGDNAGLLAEVTNYNGLGRVLVRSNGTAWHPVAPAVNQGVEATVVRIYPHQFINSAGTNPSVESDYLGTPIRSFSKNNTPKAVALLRWPVNTWTQVQIDVVWVNETADVGVVRWQAWLDGLANPLVTWGSGYTVNAPAGAQGAAVTTTMTTIAALTGAEEVRLGLSRGGGNAADTKLGGAGLRYVQLTKTA